MKLAHKNLNNCLEWDETEIGCLVIENPSFFTQIVKDIYLQTEGEEGDVVLSTPKTSVDLSKQTLFVTDFINIDLNSKKLISALQNVLKSNIASNLVLETNLLNNALSNYAQTLIDTVDFPLCFESSFDSASLLKLLNIKLQADDTLLENILNLTIASAEFLNTKLLIFVGIKAFLNKTDLQLRYHINVK